VGKPTHTRPTDRSFNRRLFAKLRRTWTPHSTVQRDQYIQSCAEFLREIEVVTEERDMIRRMQLMELAWLRNDLDHHYAHPVQRGWVNNLRSWSATADFQRVWPRARATFSQEFVRFCERALNVNQPSVLHFELDGSSSLPHPDAWADLNREFGQEFLSFFRSLDRTDHTSWRGNAEEYLEKVRTNAGTQCWLIGYGDPATDDGIVKDASQLTMVVGVAAVFEPLIPRDKPPGARELLLWVRGQFRMTGVGAVAMRILLKQERGNWNSSPPFARLPRIGSGRAEQMQRAMWVQFMNDFDFYGVPLTEQAWEERELRVRYSPP